MTKPPNRASLLGQQIDKRLTQLGMSRREFSRRANIGRQTLQDIIHDPNKRISDRTFAALDSGLKWQAGTSRAFHEGDQNARQKVGEMSTEERISDYLESILRHLSEMDIDQLEREVLMLEEESASSPRTLSESNRTSELIREHIDRLMAAWKHGVSNHQNVG